MYYIYQKIPKLYVDVLTGAGIEYKYYLYKTMKGFTAANTACGQKGMYLLLVDDIVQNERVAELLRQNGVDSVSRDYLN